MNTYTLSFHIPGTLAADITPVFTVPADCSLVHVSAAASNDSSATLKIGSAADDDAYLAATAIGDSGTPAALARANFVGGQYPHIAGGSVVKLTLDFDGASGTAAHDVTVVLTMTEG